MSIPDIRSAIRQELEATPEYYDFKVVRSEREGALWRVTIQPEAVFTDGGRANVVLDDSFESANAWWAVPAKGSAKVLTVIPEDDQIVLKDVTARPPDPGGFLRLYPPRYLQALAACWADRSWAASAFECLGNLAHPDAVEANPLSGHAFQWLRRAQRRALKLVNYSSSFLFGPPGTGKTTTLGVLLAEYLQLNPRARVLMLSTTNLAVDQATVAVDKALDAAGREAIRRRVKRLGSRIVASHYLGREHLLPVHDRELIAKLARLETQSPPTSDVKAFDAWKEQVESLRQRLRAETIQILRDARLVCMTTTRAAFTLGDLRLLPVFDLVVFDEASQVGLAHALALMPLGRTRLFAGDPQQLSPVVRSAEKEAQRWLARSPFAEKPRSIGASVCFLDEQSRMAAPINDLISHIFYDGRLKVAADVKEDQGWLRHRSLSFSGIGQDEHVHLLAVEENGTWSAKYRGPIRYPSAEKIVALVKQAIASGNVDADDLIVLTPFRAQRALIKQRLRACGVKGVRVSTVHRAQGSEVRIVIFDPVDASHPFLMTDDARRLINVAISRAQAKIVVASSPNDSLNPVFSQIAQRLRLQSDDRPALSIEELIGGLDFPSSLVGMRVKIGPVVGEVSPKTLNHGELVLIDEQTGKERAFLVEHLIRKALTGP